VGVASIIAADIALTIVVLVGLFAALRVAFEKNTLRKLPYLNVLSFAVAAAIALIIRHPLALLAAVAFFVGSTLESNAIASTFAGGSSEDD
jgi:energy-converting hydrogenase A subunit C